MEQAVEHLTGRADADRYVGVTWNHRPPRPFSKYAGSWQRWSARSGRGLYRHRTTGRNSAALYRGGYEAGRKLAADPIGRARLSATQIRTPLV